MLCNSFCNPILVWVSHEQYSIRVYCKELPKSDSKARQKQGQN